MKHLNVSVLAISLAFSQISLAQEDGTLRTSAQASPSQIVNVQTVAPSSAVAQPTTYVEASSIPESRAEKLRRARQDVEVQTEQKIVEKLEASRLEDEQKRVDRIFGNKLEAQPAVVMPVQQVVAPAPVVVEQKSVNVTQEELSATKAEIIGAINEKKQADAKEADAKSIAEAAAVQQFRKRYYIQSNVGIQGYTDAVNIDNRGAAGVVIGTELDRNFLVEGGFLYSNYILQDLYWDTRGPVYREMGQYSLTFATKYQFIFNNFRPYLGALTSYTYRSYFNRYNGGPYPGPVPPQETNSWAFDLGFTTGVNITIGDNFMIGAEFRYVTNLFHRSDMDFIALQYKPAGSQLVEDTDYTAFLINGSYRF